MASSIKIRNNCFLKNEDLSKSRPLNVKFWPLKLLTTTCSRCMMLGDTRAMFEIAKPRLGVFIWRVLRELTFIDRDNAKFSKLSSS